MRSPQHRSRSPSAIISSQGKTLGSEICAREERLTKDALKNGTSTFVKEVLCVVVILMAPGGKLVTTCDTHMIIARANSIGVARITAGSKSRNGFALTQKSASIVETFMVLIRSRCHRCCTNATARDALKAKPKAFARIFEAVVIYPWGAI